VYNARRQPWPIVKSEVTTQETLNLHPRSTFSQPDVPSSIARANSKMKLWFVLVAATGMLAAVISAAGMNVSFSNHAVRESRPARASDGSGKGSGGQFKLVDRKLDRKVAEVATLGFQGQLQKKPRTVRRETQVLVQLDEGQIEYSPENVPGSKLFLDALRLNGLADGEPMSNWPDLSGQGNHATQFDPLLRLTYHAAAFEDGLPYVSGSENTKLMNVPLPATATKTMFVVARLTVPFASGYLLKFDANNHMYSGPLSLARWGWYKKRGEQGTAAAGYYAEWTVLCVRQNGDSIAFFVDGQLVETLTPETAPSSFTQFTLGPGPGMVRQLVMFDRVLTDAEVARHTRWLRKHNRLNYRYEYLDTVVSGFSTPALIVRREGFKGARPLVILNHAAGFTERMYHDLPTFRRLLVALLDEGYIVASSALTDYPDIGYASWGNQRSLDANVELYKYVTDHYAVDKNKVAMVGTSMGGLTTLLAFPDGRIPVKGAALYSPVTNLAAQYTYKTKMAGAIRFAYGIADDGSNYSAQTEGHDPNLRPPADWTGKRLRFYGGDGDTIVPWPLNAEAFAARVNGTATESGIVTLTGDHTSNVETTVVDLLAFIRRCFE
jgi:pimeloyl-ACP methyl ester carboxylesterase